MEDAGMATLKYSFLVLCSVPAGVKWRVLMASGLIAIANEVFVTAAVLLAGGLVYLFKKDQ